MWIFFKIQKYVDHLNDKVDRILEQKMIFLPAANRLQKPGSAEQAVRAADEQTPSSQLCHPPPLHYRQHQQEDSHRL